MGLYLVPPGAVPMRLPADWKLIDRAEASKLEVELQREMSPEHVLRGRPLVAVARHEQSDGVLFVSPPPNADAGVYWVHLTWSRETMPAFPSTVPYKNVEHFAEYWPDPDDDEDP